MTPTIVHRYEIPAIEAVQAVVDIGDCREVRISLDAGVLVVDVVEPAGAELRQPVYGQGCRCQACERIYRADLLIPDDAWAKISPRDVDGDKGGGLLCPTCIMERLVDRAGWTAGRASDVDGIVAPSIEPSGEDVASVASGIPEPAPAEPERKGGRLAQQAAIACGERGFWSFLARGYGAQVETPDEARAWLCQFCGVSSRADLDHEPEAGKRWREVQQRYRLWLDGYDD